MFKSKLGRKHAVLFYITINIIYMVCCSTPDKSSANKVPGDSYADFFLNANELIVFMDSMIPEIPTDCLDALDISPLASVQSNKVLNSESKPSLQNSDNYSNLIKRTDPVRKCRETKLDALPDYNTKDSERRYSKMYMNYLKTLKESRVEFERDYLFEDLHPKDKLSYLQKNPPTTGSVLPDEPKIIIRRKMPRLLRDNTKKIKDLEDRKEKSTPLVDALKDQEIKLKKVRCQDTQLNEQISNFDKVLKELKLKLKSIKVDDFSKRFPREENSNQEIHKAKFENIENGITRTTNKLSAYKDVFHKVRFKLKSAEDDHKFLQDNFNQNTKNLERKFTTTDELIKRLSNWYRVQLFITPTTCSNTRPEAKCADEDAGVLNETGDDGFDKSPEKGKDLNTKENSDIYFATYVEIDTSDEEDDNSSTHESENGPCVSDPKRFYSSLQLTKPLELNIGSVHKDPSSSGSRQISEWKGRVSSNAGAGLSINSQDRGNSANGDRESHLQAFKSGISCRGSKGFCTKSEILKLMCVSIRNGSEQNRHHDDSHRSEWKGTISGKGGNQPSFGNLQYQFKLNNNRESDSRASNS